MDKELRNTLRNVVTRCRALLEQSIAEVLQGEFGIHRDGSIEELSRLGNLDETDRDHRERIQAHLEHIRALGFKAADAVEQFVREVAFTHLNRLCAFKMMEGRGIIREAVSRGMQSQGFLFYIADHPGEERLWSGGKQDAAYRHFLVWLGSAFAGEIGPLFSADDPANRLFPPHRILDEVLGLINGPDLRSAWQEDETIGWIYQYFTPKELRERSRKEHPAPPNSYHLAFRNQFYTPRYVVEFLVDNTLGRIWYEMLKGRTRLKETSRYLVWRPDDVFLPPGQEVGSTGSETFIRHRPKKDPREIAIIDPACGSGHFLLYCLDVLQVIYEEAYEDPDLGPALKSDYPALDDLRGALPGLILSRNLYGIDIDPRAAQIASLALWLKAQRFLRDAGGGNSRRPAGRPSNIVCAEPMPGERQFLEEFIAGLQPKALGQIVAAVFKRMELAGEAGSLLRIEEEIRDAVASARAQWQGEWERAVDRRGNPLLFTRAEISAMRPAASRQLDLFDVSDITDAQFWEVAETRVLDALRQYAGRAANGGSFTRRLFAGDTLAGFAFVDVCRTDFDVVLMNPPFGEASKPSKAYIEKAYPRTRNDVYAAFVERWIGKLRPGGMLGAITSRTGFFLSSFQKWREEVLLKEVRPAVFADLGYGVLDTAMVETAAYCVVKEKR